jgi:hypothetical protein
MKRRYRNPLARGFLPAVALIGYLALPTAAHATGKDVQLWPVARVTYGINQDWAVALVGRGRWNDDLADHRDWLLRPYVSWTPVQDVPLVDSLSVLAGYDYLSVNRGRTEHRAWQAISHTPKRGPLGFVHRVRVDERWIQGIDKVIWRARYRLGTTHQISRSPWFARFSDEIFINLNDENQGPVGGFEGNRGRVGLGRYVTDRLRFEGGYQFEYARRRGRVDEFRHTFFVEFTLATGKVRHFERRKEAPVETVGDSGDAAYR